MPVGVFRYYKNPANRLTEWLLWIAVLCGVGLELIARATRPPSYLFYIVPYFLTFRKLRILEAR